VTETEIDDAIDMSAEELADLHTEIRPVMLLLVKVSEIDFARFSNLHNSSPTNKH
jgi:hypothetical protein